MNNNQNQKKDLRKLPGFYIALCCCVLVIGLAGYFTERYEKGKTDISQQLNENDSAFSGSINSHTDSAIDHNSVPASETITHEEYDAEIQTAQSLAENQTDIAENTESNFSSQSETQPVSKITEDIEAPAEYAVNNPDTEETAVIVSADSNDFEYPVSGEILENFSDTLIFNTAMSDWRTHDGIDIAADVGCSVHTAADGTVKEIFSTASGEGILIEHSDGFSTRYMGMSSIENINEGDTVSAGDVVGIIGESKGESVTEPHLHFEMYKDGTAVNPTEYLK
ncbi:MAG: peptidoglycan DD-metalloendopeptidase family protein [Clostridia bacterium]